MSENTNVIPAENAERAAVIVEDTAEKQRNQIILNPETNYIMTMWNDAKLMTTAFKMAEMLAKSNLIPQSYQGNPSNCLIAIDMANRLNMAPMMVLQNLFIVQGRPAWSGQFCIAVINGCGKFEPLDYIYAGEPGQMSYGCYAQSKRLKSGALCKSATITMQMATDEGWSTKNSSKWKTMPEQMMKYRAASFFARTYCPEVLLGLQIIDEIEDVKGAAEDKPKVTIKL